MNITFLIGNGFDLMMGLKTSYTSFVKSYINNSSSDHLCIAKFKKQIESNIGTWADAELAFGKYTSFFSLQEIDNYIKCHNDFCLKLADYLKRQDETFDVSLHAKSIVPAFQSAILQFHSFLLPKFSQEISYFLKMNRQEDRVYSFINFNYTTLFDRCLFSAFPIDKTFQTRREGANTFNDRIGSVIHIHGVTTSKLIMGVNDETQIENSSLLSIRNFKRLFIKPISNEMNHVGNDEACLQMIINSRIIVVYGMSLGATDKIWWIRIKNWLSVGKDRFLILFMYKQDYNDIIQSSYLQAEESIEDLFFTNADVPLEEQDQLRSQIFITFNIPLFGERPIHYKNNI